MAILVISMGLIFQNAQYEITKEELDHCYYNQCMVKLSGRDGFERIAVMREKTVKTIYGSSSPRATSRLNFGIIMMNLTSLAMTLLYCWSHCIYLYHSSPTCVGMVPPKGHASTLLRKDQLEVSLREEKKLIEDGRLKEDNPLDISEGFQKLCEACRRGDLKLCQEIITAGVNINARDQFDYSPLILVGNLSFQMQTHAPT